MKGEPIMNARTIVSRLVMIALLALLAPAAQAAGGPVHAYVTSTNVPPSVSVIDTATNTTAATISGVGGQSLAVSADGSLLLAATAAGDALAIIDTRTNTVTATVPDSGPWAVAMTPDKAFAYVLHLGTDAASSTVSVINLATQAVAATLQAPTGATALAMTPDGSTVWVGGAALSTPQITVIDTASKSVVTTFPARAAGDFGPYAIAFTQSGGFAYVANFDNTVSVINTGNHAIVATIPVGALPWHIAMTPNGAFAYVANMAAGTVSVIDTTAQSVVATVPVGTAPVAISFTPDGAFAYVTNVGSDAISVIDTATRTVVNTLNLRLPWGIAIGLANPPPDCSHATASPNLLWPPNHKFVSIQIAGIVNPAGGAVTISVTGIFQDEPVSGGPDATGVGTGSPSVRAERDGNGDGRVYHINFTATGASGSCTGSVTVGVPHDQGHGSLVDEGPLYDSTAP
jgi:YVTN family beta-propeller protein